MIHRYTFPLSYDHTATSYNQPAATYTRSSIPIPRYDLPYITTLIQAHTYACILSPNAFALEYHGVSQGGSQTPYTVRYTLPPHRRRGYHHAMPYYITTDLIVWLAAAADQDRSCSLSSLFAAIKFV